MKFKQLYESKIYNKDTINSKIKNELPELNYELLSYNDEDFIIKITDERYLGANAFKLSGLFQRIFGILGKGNRFNIAKAELYITDYSNEKAMKELIAEYKSEPESFIVFENTLYYVKSSKIYSPKIYGKSLNVYEGIYKNGGYDIFLDIHRKDEIPEKYKNIFKNSELKSLRHLTQKEYEELEYQENKHIWIKRKG